MKSDSLNSTAWRKGFVLIFLICAGLVGFALYLQHAKGLEPCPLCILQRIAFIGIGLLALAAGLQNPHSRGRMVYTGLMFVFALVGATIAGRHSWLQYNPDPLAGCGPDLAYTLENFPLSQAFPIIFKGSGPCSSIDWQFMGLSMPAWSLLFLSGLALILMWLFIRSTRTG